MAKHKIIAKLHSKSIYMRKEDSSITYCFIPVEPNDGKAISLMKYDIDPNEEMYKLVIDMEYSIDYDDENIETEDVPEMSQGLAPCTIDYFDSLSPDKPIDSLYLILV